MAWFTVFMILIDLSYVITMNNLTVSTLSSITNYKELTTNFSENFFLTSTIAEVRESIQTTKSHSKSYRNINWSSVKEMGNARISPTTSARMTSSQNMFSMAHLLTTTTAASHKSTIISTPIKMSSVPKSSGTTIVPGGHNSVVLTSGNDMLSKFSTKESHRSSLKWKENTTVFKFDITTAHHSSTKFLKQTQTSVKSYDTMNSKDLRLETTSVSFTLLKQLHSNIQDKLEMSSNESSTSKLIPQHKTQVETIYFVKTISKIWPSNSFNYETSFAEYKSHQTSQIERYLLNTSNTDTVFQHDNTASLLPKKSTKVNLMRFSLKSSFIYNTSSHTLPFIQEIPKNTVPNFPNSFSEDRSLALSSSVIEANKQYNTFVNNVQNVSTSFHPKPSAIPNITTMNKSLNKSYTTKLFHKNQSFDNVSIMLYTQTMDTISKWPSGHTIGSILPITDTVQAHTMLHSQKSIIKVTSSEIGLITKSKTITSFNLSAQPHMSETGVNFNLLGVKQSNTTTPHSQTSTVKQTPSSMLNIIMSRASNKYPNVQSNFSTISKTIYASLLNNHVSSSDIKSTKGSSSDDLSKTVSYTYNNSKAIFYRNYTTPFKMSSTTNIAKSVHVNPVWTSFSNDQTIHTTKEPISGENMASILTPIRDYLSTTVLSSENTAQTVLTMTSRKSSHSTASLRLYFNTNFSSIKSSNRISQQQSSQLTSSLPSTSSSSGKGTSVRGTYNTSKGYTSNTLIKPSLPLSSFTDPKHTPMKNDSNFTTTLRSEFRHSVFSHKAHDYNFSSFTSILRSTVDKDSDNPSKMNFTPFKTHDYKTGILQLPSTKVTSTFKLTVLKSLNYLIKSNTTTQETWTQSSTIVQEIVQLCKSWRREKCICNGPPPSGNKRVACIELLSMPERRAAVSLRLKSLKGLENHQDLIKATIAELVTNVCNNQSYHCIPVPNIQSSVVQSSTKVPVTSNSLLQNTLVPSYRNISSFFYSLSQLSTISFENRRQQDSFNSTSKNSSWNISETTKYNSLTINTKVKTKRKKRSLSEQTLINVNADDVFIVKMEPARVEKEAVLAFLVRYSLANDTNNTTKILDANTLSPILIKNTGYLEGKLNVSIQGVLLWTTTPNTTASPIMSSHPGPTVGRRLSSHTDDEDSKIIIVAIAVGVTCVLMLLIMIAVVMARMNNKWQGEFVPGNNISGSITADPNTQEMIAASVDPAPRITDVPFKSPKVKKNTKVNLSRLEYTTSQI